MNRISAYGAPRGLLSVLVLLGLGQLGLGQEAPPHLSGGDLESEEIFPSDADLTRFAEYPGEHRPGLHNCAGCAAPSCRARAGFFGGADFLFIRPHFSEAIAFARGSQTPASFDAVAEPLDFDYDGSLRAFVGYRDEQGDGELRFSYWHLQGDTGVAAATPGPGQFFVDPMGNLVGSATVIDPSDARFGQTVTGGDSIATRASVDLNLFDIELGTAVYLKNPNWTLDVSAGVRIAEVDQFYDSVIRDAAGNVLTRGDYSVDFVGAGPRFGAGLKRVFGKNRQFSVYADGDGGLVLGQYDVAFSNSVGQFRGSQAERMTRLIPVMDAELGAAWRGPRGLTVSGGWLFQGWYDLGTSGGHFGGFFSGADDANIMSFDGLFVRAEVAL